MREVTQTTDNKFLNLNLVVDTENNVGGYQFAERRGTDSVAFVCYDRDTSEFLVSNEYKPPVNEFIDGAFGGSLDKEVPKLSIVIDEVKEEAGFVVEWRDVIPVGRSFVSTQMNQYCYLYLVYVDKTEEQDREPENAVEAMAETKWVQIDELNRSDDWKSIVIATKAEAQGLLYV